MSPTLWRCASFLADQLEGPWLLSVIVMMWQQYASVGFLSYHYHYYYPTDSGLNLPSYIHKQDLQIHKEEFVVNPGPRSSTLLQPLFHCLLHQPMTLSVCWGSLQFDVKHYQLEAVLPRLKMEIASSESGVNCRPKELSISCSRLWWGWCMLLVRMAPTSRPCLTASTPPRTSPLRCQSPKWLAPHMISSSLKNLFSIISHTKLGCHLPIWLSPSHSSLPTFG